MIEIEIDGKKLEVAPNSTIIQAADDAGIYIPRFCYHKKLSVAANCRMCLVEVEKAPKTLPACATPVMPGMKVSTRSEKALASQKTVMEFLLINHPLDCPVCDQGGECELQDLSMGYGRGISRYNQGKRSVHSEDIGPLIATEMTRCIQCTRCVRFGDEIAGLPELGKIGRGEDLEIATYVEQAVESELSGNMIDVCPVGALTSKPYRFSARAWEMTQHASIAPHDCLGSNIYIHTRGEIYSPQRHVMRVVPRENEAINETWISDRDRFSYEAINSPERILNPFIKRDGQWVEVSWHEALTQAACRLQNVISSAGAEQIAALVSPSATFEEGYLLQQFMRGLGSPHIDHRLRQQDFRGQAQAPLYPNLGMPIAELEQQNAILLIGSYVRHEQPLASQRIRKATRKGAKVSVVNPMDYTFNFKLANKDIINSGRFINSLLGILKALSQQADAKSLPQQLLSALESVSPQPAHQTIAQDLLAGEKAAVILGAYATHHADAAIINELAQWIAKLSNATFGVFSEGANSAGLWLAGAVPHRQAFGQPAAQTGLNAYEMFKQPRQAYILLGVEPELDSAYAGLALQALQQANTVIAFSAFRGSAMEDYADIIFPIATFAETAGTYVNVAGTLQTVAPAALPLGNAQPAGAILQQLAKLLKLSGFDEAALQNSLVQASNTLAAPLVVTDMDVNLLTGLSASAGQDIHLLVEWPIYGIDSLVRRASALQLSRQVAFNTLHLNTALAKQLRLEEGKPVTVTQQQASMTLPWMIDDSLADGQVAVVAGSQALQGVGIVMGKIHLKSENG